ncbi:SET domain protein 2 isoform 1 [Dorcoceras hygrometricum]|uniref:SET domain protein 2 isoform 1 n=1 Tax=Dorcoceras hygrometricum TaxID=472368 RepID=A0A2Z7DHU0_9LAMI|nr:SET domain protein 2 isoform 1 [Dorcoceras hygrometricum]
MLIFIYEAALVDFFENASVRDGVIISTVAGQLVEISEEWFAESFDLPVDGLSELSEIPKDVVFYARSIVSMSGEPVSLSGKKSHMKIEYRLLCDIMAKSISVKAGSFNAITVEKFSMLTAVVCGISLLLENIPNLELGESSEFPASKILTEKTVHRYVSINDKVGAEEATGAPKTKAASKKRPAAVLGDEPVVKKKRTMKKKSSSSKVNLEIVVVAQEAVPIQMVEPTTDAPAAEDIFAQPAAVDEIPVDPPADEVAGETVDEEAADEGAYEETADGDAARVNEPASEPAVADIMIEEPSTADDVDVIIEQFLVDWAVRMRIRPPELETSICDAKYHVSLSTRSVLGKWVYLVTLAMSLFDLQDVCIAIGSLTTLDLPMVVDLIGIYGFKRTVLLPRPTRPPPFLSSKASRRRPPPKRRRPPPPHVDRTCSDHHFEKFPFVLISSGLLVQADEGTLLPVVDLIRRNLPPPTVKIQSLCDSGWSQAPVASEVTPRETPYEWFIVLFVLY